MSKVSVRFSPGTMGLRRRDSSTAKEAAVVGTPGELAGAFLARRACDHDHAARFDTSFHFNRKCPRLGAMREAADDARRPSRWTP